eukprot:m.16965 g.16965  ORF g.16965 m.16965 type:complete len:377 (-) comp4699_c0_seq1:216-1346(-)
MSDNNHKVATSSTRSVSRRDAAFKRGNARLAATPSSSTTSIPKMKNPDVPKAIITSSLFAVGKDGKIQRNPSFSGLAKPNMSGTISVPLRILQQSPQLMRLLTGSPKINQNDQIIINTGKGLAVSMPSPTFAKAHPNDKESSNTPSSSAPNNPFAQSFARASQQKQTKKHEEPSVFSASFAKMQQQQQQLGKRRSSLSSSVSASINLPSKVARTNNNSSFPDEVLLPEASLQTMIPPQPKSSIELPSASLSSVHALKYVPTTRTEIVDAPPKAKRGRKPKSAPPLELYVERKHGESDADFKIRERKERNRIAAAACRKRKEQLESLLKAELEGKKIEYNTLHEECISLERRLVQLQEVAIIHLQASCRGIEVETSK